MSSRRHPGPGNLVQMATPGDDSTDDAHDLEAAVAEVYGGPLASFVAQRDALARTLRSAGRRDEATRVKALKKPKAVAWALNAGGRADRAAVDELASAVDGVGEAQATGGDVRAAIARLRAAEAALVDTAGGAARTHDHPVDQAVLASALRAVVGDPDAMAALRSGRLVDSPGAGGLGVAMTGGPPASRTGPPARDRATPRARQEPARTDAATSSIAAARRAVAAAERAATAAAKAARKASTTAEAAEARARRTDDEAASARRRADDALDAAQRARREADARAAERDATAAELASARDALEGLRGGGR